MSRHSRSTAGIELRYKRKTIPFACDDCRAGRVCECSGDAYDYAVSRDWMGWSMYRDGVQLWQRAKGGTGETARNAYRKPKEAA